MDISSLNVLLTRSFLLPASSLLLVGTGIIGMFSNQGCFFPIRRTLEQICKNLAILFCLFGFMLLGFAFMAELLLSPTELAIELSESMRAELRTFVDRSYWELLFLGCSALVLFTASLVIAYFSRKKMEGTYTYTAVGYSVPPLNGEEQKPLKRL